MPVECPRWQNPSFTLVLDLLALTGLQFGRQEIDLRHPVRQRRRVHVDDVPQLLRKPVGHRGTSDRRAAVQHQHHVVEVADDLGDVVNVCPDPHLRAKLIDPFTLPGQRHDLHLVTDRSQQVSAPLPHSWAEEEAWDQNICRHLCSPRIESRPDSSGALEARREPGQIRSALTSAGSTWAMSLGPAAARSGADIRQG